MKTFAIPSLVTIAILVRVSFALPQKPKPKTLDELAPFIKVQNIKEDRPAIRPTAKRQLVRYGPWDLPAANPEAKSGGHAHAEPSGSSGGIMGGSGASGMAMLDTMAFFRGGITLAIADYLSKTMDPEGFNFMHQTREGMCKDCTILAVKMDVVFENGTRADISSGVYLHHIIALNLGEREMKNSLMASPIPFCSGSDWAMSLASSAAKTMTYLGQKVRSSVFGFGAVDEFKQWFTTPDGKYDSGYYMGTDDHLFFQGEIVNYRPEPSRVYLQMDIEFVPGKVGKEVSTTFTTVSACNESMTFKGQNGAGKYIGKGMKISMDGAIIASRGHMHDGGEAMIATVNGKRICTSKAEYGKSYSASPGASKWTTISRMTDCNDVVPVKKGDVISLQADYDTLKHPLRESNGSQQTQMGLVVFTFVPK